MEEKTVFVIGAGASYEVGMPLGVGLKEEIARILDFENSHFQDFGKKILNKCIEQNGLLYSASCIREGIPWAISIDNFIDSHRDNDKIAICGKLAIVVSILAAERKCHLYFNPKNIKSNLHVNFEFLKGPWYRPFFKLLTENCRAEDLADRFKNITLIIFNYDRCVEHFLYHTLKNYYGISSEESKISIENINIFHPYGSVGKLEWMIPRPRIGFGQEPTKQQLFYLSEGIKTFTEGIDPQSSEILKIREHVYNANKLVFLGFAFHELNMNLIAPEKHRFRTKEEGRVKCYATAKGFSDHDIENIKERIKKMFLGNATLRAYSNRRYCGILL